MPKTDLIRWIKYWDAASGGPNLHRVETLEDMTTCRTFNPCMQGGVVADVTDEEMFSALLEHRAMVRA